MGDERPPRLRLFDILDCIRQIEQSLQGATFEEFRSHTIRYRAIERWLEIISEASRHVGDDLKERESAIDWKQIANFGNVMRHGYESVDFRILWNIVTYDLPLLKAAAARLYASVKSPADPWPDPEPSDQG